MRVAYVCRDLGRDRLTGPGALVFESAVILVRAGHEVYLISEGLATPRARALSVARTLTWVQVEHTRGDHRYFTERQAYADRVYDTVRRLSQRCPLDLVEFVDIGGEALTTLRAKRLLGEFAMTTIAVSLNPWATASQGAEAYQPVSFHDTVTAFAERYCLDHTDVVIACSRAAVRQTRLPHDRVVLRPPGPVPQDLPPLRPPEPTAAWTVCHLGGLRPGSGTETFLEAAGLALERDQRLRFIMWGDDSLTDPVGRSYLAHVCRRLPQRLRDALVFRGPLHSGDLHSMPPAGSQCVLPESTTEGPTSTLLAMALGYQVIAREGSVAAELVQDGSSGRIVAEGDAQALAKALLAGVADSARAAETARQAARTARGGHDAAHVAEALAALWRRVQMPRRPAPASTPGELVSVVIPLHNQGRYLYDAVASVRRSDYRPVEIVVVDDGSTDRRTIEAFDALDGVVKVRQPNAGLSAARNAGLAHCRGRYVVPLDADDLLPPQFIGMAVQALRRNPELGYVTGYLRYFGLLEFVHVPLGHVLDLSLVLNTYARATGVFRREALQAVGGYDEELPAFEDWDLHIRLHNAGYESDVLPIDGQLYRRHLESMTFRTSNAGRLELLQYLLHKHAGAVPPERVGVLLLTLVHLWKTQYEPSASVRLRSDLDGVATAGALVRDLARTGQA